MTINEFAKICGVSESDAEGFVMCISARVNSGESIEDAIKNHQKTMENVANNSMNFVRSGQAKDYVVNAFFPD